MNRTILEFATIPLGQNGSRQDNMVRKKIIFPDLLTTSNVRWNNIGTQAPSRKAEKTYEKLIILIEESEIIAE